MLRLRNYNPSAREEAKRFKTDMSEDSRLASFGRDLVISTLVAHPSIPLVAIPVIAAGFAQFAETFAPAINAATAVDPHRRDSRVLQAALRRATSFRLSTRTGKSHLMHEASLINQANVELLRNNKWTGYFDELAGSGNTKVWVLMAIAVINGLFRRIVIGSADTSEDGTGLNEFKKLTVSQGLMETNINNCSEGCASACAVQELQSAIIGSIRQGE